MCLMHNAAFFNVYPEKSVFLVFSSVISFVKLSAFNMDKTPLWERSSHLKAQKSNI